MTSIEIFRRLTPRGKRRAVVIWIVSGVLGTGIVLVGGYLLCALTAGMQVLAGVY